MKHFEDLRDISKYAGERFDLVQAGGGNSSVKLETGEMVIKASGYALSDVTLNSAHSTVNNQMVAEIVNNEIIVNEKNKRKKEELTAKAVRNATLDKKNRPSIETLLHSLLDKYTLHTHPVAVNAILIRPDWEELLKSIFPTDDVVYVEYQTPGIELALKLKDELTKFNYVPSIIFLQNHGLIITTRSKQGVFEKTEYVLAKIEQYLKIDFSKYKRTNQISSLVRTVKKNDNISFLTEDALINYYLKGNNDLLKKKPFCPDSFVYCGVNGVFIKDLYDANPIKEYLAKYHELPKLIIFNNSLYINAKNVKKAKEIEEVLKFNLLVLENCGNEINYLAAGELAYLSNWEAEKFRQEL